MSTGDFRNPATVRVLKGIVMTGLHISTAGSPGGWTDRVGATLWAFVKRVWAAWQKRRATRREQVVTRRAFQTLHSMDEALLRDIGVTRHEVEWASQLPMHTNAARALRETSMRRRAAEAIGSAGSKR